MKLSSTPHTLNYSFQVKHSRHRFGGGFSFRSYVKHEVSLVWRSSTLFRRTRPGTLASVDSSHSEIRQRDKSSKSYEPEWEFKQIKLIEGCIAPHALESHFQKNLHNFFQDVIFLFMRFFVITFPEEADIFCLDNTKFQMRWHSLNKEAVYYTKVLVL